MKLTQMFNVNTPRLVNMAGKAFSGGARRQAVLYMNSMGGQRNTVPTHRLARWLARHNTAGMGYRECLDFVNRNKHG